MSLTGEQLGIVFIENKKGQQRVIRGSIKKTLGYSWRNIEKTLAYLSGQTDLKIGRMESRIEKVELPVTRVQLSTLVKREPARWRSH